jgi:hypothetical protein
VFLNGSVNLRDQFDVAKGVSIGKFELLRSERVILESNSAMKKDGNFNDMFVLDE